MSFPGPRRWRSGVKDSGMKSVVADRASDLVAMLWRVIYQNVHSQKVIITKPPRNADAEDQLISQCVLPGLVICEQNGIKSSNLKKKIKWSDIGVKTYQRIKVIFVLQESRMSCQLSGSRIFLLLRVLNAIRLVKLRGGAITAVIANV